jgi:predicted DNA binding CopG/RHH family protein
VLSSLYQFKLNGLSEHLLNHQCVDINETHTMKRIAIHITQKQYEAYKQFAQREGLPYSELIRRALDEFLRRYADDLPKYPSDKCDKRTN